jgi:hypothetical protein
VAVAALNSSEGTAIAVDPVTLGLLMRVYFNGTNDDRVSYVADTLPVSATCTYEVTFTISIRNDGWNELQSSKYKVKTAIVSRAALLPATQNLKAWSSPFVPASSLSARLIREGWALVDIPFSATESYFPLPNDVSEKETVIVAANQTMPSCSNPELIVLEYEIIHSNGSKLDGQLSWRSSILLYPKPQP